VIGNCAISALVDSRANVLWCCMPRFDSDPVFHALLHADADRGAGSMGVELEGFVRSEWRYDPGTAILRTRLYDDAGNAVEVCDFAPRFRQHERMFRPAQLVRRLRPLSGRPLIRIRMAPRGQWGAELPTLTRGSNHVRYAFAGMTLRLNTDLPPSYVIDGSWFTLRSTVSLMLGPDETLDGAVESIARDFEERTGLYWQHWTQRLSIPLEWQEAVIRAAIALKLCQFEETGAIVAAMTTSIPEAPGSRRNWDYRYCWLRDAFFVVRALNSLSEVGTMEDYLRWLHDIVRRARMSGGHVQPLYGIGMESELPERELPHLAGYRGMGPVRVGNQASEHFQHDVYGNIVLGAAQAFHDQRLLRRADASDFEALEDMGEQAWRLHDQPDAGMWELRTRARIHTSSSLMCWAACDRLAKIAAVLRQPLRQVLWSERARHIREVILARAWHAERGVFAESFGGRDLDASVLLMAEVGFIDPNDARFLSTLRVLEEQLCQGSHMTRYGTPDDFGMPETSFNVCAFWRIDALARTGRAEAARAHFEALLACRNSLGLLSEDIAAGSGELWGNFPQTYSMAGIISCAVRLSKPWDIVV